MSTSEGVRSRCLKRRGAFLTRTALSSNLPLRELANELLSRDQAATDYLTECERTVANRLLVDHVTKLVPAVDPIAIAFDMIDRSEPPRPEADFFSTLRAFAVLSVVADRLARMAIRIHASQLRATKQAEGTTA
jgi:hypothetical protein